jgi:hypothetical protein
MSAVASAFRIARVLRSDLSFLSAAVALVANAPMLETVDSYTPGTVMVLPSVVVVATGLLAGARAPAGADRTKAVHASNRKADVRKEFIALSRMAKCWLDEA